MCSKDGFRYAASLEQTEAEQNRVAHTAPNGPGYIRCLSDLLDQHRIDADNHHNQKGLEAQRQQGFQVVLTDAAPLRIAQRGKGDRPQRSHGINLNHSAVGHKENTDGKNVHRQPHNKGLEPQAEQRPDVHSFQLCFKVGNEGVKVNAGFPDNHPGALVDDGLGGVENAHDDIPCVRHNENGKSTFENPAEEHGRVKIVHIVLFHDHVYQLIAHDNGKDRRCNGDDHRVRQGLQHIEYAAVPRLRRRPHIRGDFPDFRIDRAEQPGQVAHDAVD